MRSGGIIVKMEEINVRGTISLEDKPARELIEMLDTRIGTINERTKTHTIYMRDFEKRLKELEKKGQL